MFKRSFLALALVITSGVVQALPHGSHTKAEAMANASASSHSTGNGFAESEASANSFASSNTIGDGGSSGCSSGCSGNGKGDSVKPDGEGKTHKIDNAGNVKNCEKGGLLGTGLLGGSGGGLLGSGGVLGTGLLKECNDTDDGGQKVGRLFDVPKLLS